MADQPQGENGLDAIDDENNEGEYWMALAAIKRAVEGGMSHEAARRVFGIEGHPAFADLWPPTKYWGDAAWARKLRYGKGPNDDWLRIESTSPGMGPPVPDLVSSLSEWTPSGAEEASARQHVRGQRRGIGVRSAADRVANGAPVCPPNWPLTWHLAALRLS